MTVDNSHNAHAGAHDKGHSAVSHDEGRNAGPSTVVLNDPPFDPMTNFTLLGFLLGRLLDKDESEKEIDLVLDE